MIVQVHLAAVHAIHHVTARLPLHPAPVAIAPVAVVAAEAVHHHVAADVLEHPNHRPAPVVRALAAEVALVVAPLGVQEVAPAVALADVLVVAVQVAVLLVLENAKVSVQVFAPQVATAAIVVVVVLAVVLVLAQELVFNIALELVTIHVMTLALELAEHTVA